MPSKLWAVLPQRARKINPSGLGLYYSPESEHPGRCVGCHFVALFLRKEDAVNASSGWRGAKVVPVTVEQIKESS